MMSLMHIIWNQASTWQFHILKAQTAVNHIQKQISMHPLSVCRRTILWISSSDGVCEGSVWMSMSIWDCTFCIHQWVWGPFYTKQLLGCCFVLLQYLQLTRWNCIKTYDTGLNTACQLKPSRHSYLIVNLSPRGDLSSWGLKFTSTCCRQTNKLSFIFGWIVPLRTIYRHALDNINV